MRYAQVLLVVALALPAWIPVQAQEQSQGSCPGGLTLSQIAELLADQQGWSFALYHRELVRSAVCVKRDTSSVRYAQPGSSEVVLSIINGYYLDIAMIGTGFREYQERLQKKQPPGAILFVAVRLAPKETLFGGRYVPALELTGGQTEFHLALKPSGDVTLAQAWSASGLNVRYIDFMPRPVCTDRGIADSRHLYYPPLTSDESWSFSRRYGVALCALIKGGLFERKYPIAIGQARIPDLGEVAVRAGLLTERPGDVPTQAFSITPEAEERIYSYVHLKFPPLEKDTPVERKIVVRPTTGEPHRWGSGQQQLKAGWTDEWFWYGVPQGMCSSGCTIEWTVNGTLVATISQRIGSTP